jgi:hypothetical protein
MPLPHIATRLLIYYSFWRAWFINEAGSYLHPGFIPISFLWRYTYVLMANMVQPSPAGRVGMHGAHIMIEEANFDDVVWWFIHSIQHLRITQRIPQQHNILSTLQEQAKLHNKGFAMEVEARI